MHSYDGSCMAIVYLRGVMVRDDEVVFPGYSSSFEEDLECSRLNREIYHDKNNSVSATPYATIRNCFPRPSCRHYGIQILRFGRLPFLRKILDFRRT